MSTPFRKAYVIEPHERQQIVGSRPVTKLVCALCNQRSTGSHLHLIASGTQSTICTDCARTLAEGLTKILLTQ